MLNSISGPEVKPTPKHGGENKPTPKHGGENKPTPGDFHRCLFERTNFQICTKIIVYAKNTFIVKNTKLNLTENGEMIFFHFV
jgi:hypothetical protein